MGKSIANLYRYAEISRSIIKRYLAAIPDISLDKVPEKEIMALSAPKEAGGRRYTGFNLLSEETIKTLKVISSGYTKFSLIIYVACKHDFTQYCLHGTKIVHF